MALHLPHKTRRQIVYAATAVIVSGGALLALRHPALKAPIAKPPAKSAPSAALNAHPETQDKVEAPVAEAAAAVTTTEQATREKVTIHVVTEGETAGTIAENYGLKTDTVLQANDMTEEDTLSIGQELQIPRMDALVYEVESGDTLWGIAMLYGVSDTDLVSANPDMDPGAIKPGDKLLVPGGTAPVRRQVASRGTSRSRGLSYWPTVGTITDSFGWRIHPVYGSSSFHDGMDMNAASGTPLRAAAGGTVTMASRYGGYGLTVRIDHGGGLITQYAHLSQIDVAEGQAVRAGEHIGYSGNTGVSTGPHLHFMVIVDGTPTDPYPWLP